MPRELNDRELGHYWANCRWTLRSPPRRSLPHFFSGPANPVQLGSYRGSSRSNHQLPPCVLCVLESDLRCYGGMLLKWLSWLTPSVCSIIVVRITRRKAQRTRIRKWVVIIRLIVVFPILHRVSSDAASSRRSSIGLALRISSVRSSGSTGTGVSTADSRSASLLEWAETVSNF